MVVPVRFHRLDARRVALESAFCLHLRCLRAELGTRFTRVTVAAPTMAPADYLRDQAHLGTLDQDLDGIRWVALQPGAAGRIAFWLRHAPGVVRRLWREVRAADFVHAGTSHDVYRPIEFLALLFARLQARRSQCVVDIDLRGEARMRRQTGSLGLRSYVLCRALYEPLRGIQLRLAVRWCGLVLLKGRRLCADYGRGRPHVKYILEAAFSSEHLLTPAAERQRASELADPERDLELIYFGRLVAYKGVECCLAAVLAAARGGATRVRFTILGVGPESARLQELARAAGSAVRIDFEPPLPFGPQLFARLARAHLLLAAPLSEDTPRSALDAMAAGLPVLAFATEYYTSLAESGAVELVPWPSVEALAERIAWFEADKRRLAPLARAATLFARANTQEHWMRRRARWTLALFEPQPALLAEVRR